MCSCHRDRKPEHSDACQASKRRYWRRIHPNDNPRITPNMIARFLRRQGA